MEKTVKKLVSLNPDTYKSISLDLAVNKYAKYFHDCKLCKDDDIKLFTEWLESEI